jgi:hypothetical protein
MNDESGSGNRAAYFIECAICLCIYLTKATVKNAKTKGPTRENPGRPRLQHGSAASFDGIKQCFFNFRL